MTNKCDFNGKLSYALVLIILIISFANLLTAESFNNIVDDISRKYEEAKKPAKLDAIIIRDNNCTYCYDVSALINEIETENASIVSRNNLDYRSEEAKKQILKYRIDRVPAMIISGEIHKTDGLYAKLKEVGEITGNVLVFKNPSMPYIDLATGKITGNVKVVLISASNCDECYFHEKYIAELKILGIPTSDREVIGYDSNIGRAIVKEKKIERVPTFILSGDLDRYPALKKIQDYENNEFVLRNVIGPYFSLIDGKIHSSDVKSK